uniref:Uncharacterized protein n=1 Tax=Glossina palpalis gambiensis TaxID=67801 RepID=A0A1B0BWD5_9MUSC
MTKVKIVKVCLSAAGSDDKGNSTLKELLTHEIVNAIGPTSNATRSLEDDDGDDNDDNDDDDDDDDDDDADDDADADLLLNVISAAAADADAAAGVAAVVLQGTYMYSSDQKPKTLNTTVHCTPHEIVNAIGPTSNATRSLEDDDGDDNDDNDDDDDDDDADDDADADSVTKLARKAKSTKPTQSFTHPTPQSPNLNSQLLTETQLY